MNVGFGRKLISALERASRWLRAPDPDGFERQRLDAIRDAKALREHYETAWEEVYDRRKLAERRRAVAFWGPNLGGFEGWERRIAVRRSSDRIDADP